MTVLMITIDGGTLSIAFRAQVHPSCSWRALTTAAPTGRHRSLPFPLHSKSDLRSSRGGRERGPAALQSRAMGRGTLRLIDHLGLDLVGHSTGGQVLAADHSDRVASLVLGANWARLDARLRKLFVFRCTSRWVLIGAARPGIRRRKSRRRASMRCSLMTPENACEVSETRRC
jgi:pimeloyl-ACP methyl ester carboxylesterase